MWVFPKKWCVSPHFTPQVLIIFNRKTHGFVGETHHFRKPPYVFHLSFLLHKIPSLLRKSWASNRETFLDIKFHVVESFRSPFTFCFGRSEKSLKNISSGRSAPKTFATKGLFARKVVWGPVFRIRTPAKMVCSWCYRMAEIWAIAVFFWCFCWVEFGNDIDVVRTNTNQGKSR